MSALLRGCLRLGSVSARRPLSFEAAPVAPLKPPRMTPNVMHGTRLGTDPRWRRRFLEDMYKRRVLAGPDPERPRSAWSNWSRRVELSALRHRLGLAGLPGFTANRLDGALTFGYADGGGADEDESADSVVTAANASEGSSAAAAGFSNAALVPAGRELIARLCRLFLARECRHVPESLRRQAVDRLCSDESLAYVAGHLGLTELLAGGGVDTRLSSVSLARLADAFAALVASAQDCGAEGAAGEEAAWRLVRDFLLTRLHDADINEWWNVGEAPEAELLLRESLAAAGFPADEPLEFRLMRQSAPNSPVFACFQVGLYIRRELLACGFGEEPRLAKAECVSETLKALFDTGDSRAPFDFRLRLADLTAAAPEQPALRAQNS